MIYKIAFSLVSRMWRNDVSMIFLISSTISISSTRLRLQLRLSCSLEKHALFSHSTSVRLERNFRIPLRRFASPPCVFFMYVGNNERDVNRNVTPTFVRDTEVFPECTRASPSSSYRDSDAAMPLCGSSI